MSEVDSKEAHHADEDEVDGEQELADVFVHLHGKLALRALHGEAAGDEEKGATCEGDDADDWRNEVLFFSGDLEGAEIDGFLGGGEADALADEDEDADGDEEEADDEFGVHEMSEG